MSESIDISIGLRIKEVRVHKRLSCEKLASESGLTPQFISMVENGRRGLGAESLSSIARALNITSDYLLYGNKNVDDKLDYAAQAMASLSEVERECAEAILGSISKILRQR